MFGEEGSESVSMVWSMDLGITETVNDNEAGLGRKSAQSAEGMQGLQDSIHESQTRIGNTTWEKEEDIVFCVQTNHLFFTFSYLAVIEDFEYLDPN